MTKSKKIPAAERTRVGVMTQLVDPQNPREFEQFLRIEQQMDGALEGLTADVRVDLVDGELFVRSINFTATEPLPFATVGSAAMRELRFGEILWIVEQCLSQTHDVDQQLADLTLPYLTAVRKHKRRPGRRGTPDVIWADIARKRIEAEDAAPRNAIRYMIKTWPDDFGGDGAVASYIKSTDAKVNRARRKGMLEGRGKTLRLTDKAIELLEGAQS